MAGHRKIKSRSRDEGIGVILFGELQILLYHMNVTMKLIQSSNQYAGSTMLSLFLFMLLEYLIIAVVT